MLIKEETSLHHYKTIGELDSIFDILSFKHSLQTFTPSGYKNLDNSCFLMTIKLAILSEFKGKYLKTICLKFEESKQNLSLTFA